MTREIGLQEILVNQFNYMTSDMYTSIPGRIITVHNNLSEMTVDVQPVIDMMTEDREEVIARPTILNVPLHMPVTESGGLTYPISKGTPVWLVFSMRGLDKWKRGDGGNSAPTDLRKFSIRDCIAFPGVYPTGLAPNNPSKRTNSHDPEDVVLVHNIGSGNEVEIRLKTNGDVIINSPGKVEVNCETAEINSDETSINSDEVNINSDSFNVNTGTYSIVATETATVSGTLSHNGSFILNSIPMESHIHDGDSGGETGQPKAG